MLPLRLHCDALQSFEAHLRATADALAAALEHPTVTLGSLLPRLPVVRDASRPFLISTVVDVMVDERDSAFGEAQAESGQLPVDKEYFELFLKLAIRTDGQSARRFALQVVHASQLYDSASVRQRFSELDTLLSGLRNPAERPIAELALLDASAQARLTACNDTARPIPLDQPIHRWVEQQAERTPDAMALISEAGTLRYAELEARANQLAYWLCAQGVGEDDPVAVCVTRNASAVVALLATLKAGGCYLPLDPEYPSERLAFMLTDAQPKALISNFGDVVPEHVARLLSEPGAPTVIDLQRDAARLAAQTPVALPVLSSTAALAYVIYTSGSTGKPKGVRLPHQGPVNQYLHYQRALQIDADSRFLVFSSLSFDLTQRNLWAPLMAGGTVVLVDSPDYDVVEIAGLIERHRITHLCCTPSGFYPLVDTEAGADLCKLKSLREVALGGESIQMSRLSAWRASPHAKAAITNCYGPTETSANVALYRLAADAVVEELELPIGVAISNVQLHVLDENGQVLPFGVAGELYIGGIQLARDYLGQPERTAERFVQHPRLGRLYRTGDRCRRRPNGLLEYLGRVDTQLKWRGFRIEPGEIEAALVGHEAIAEAMVDLRERSPGDPRLIAWITLRDPANEPPATELRHQLKANLPSYMVPQQIVAIPGLPRLPNGKLDRKALPDPFRHAMPEAVARTPPRTAAEQAVAAIWSDMLGIQSIGIDDRFTDLGGHSLLAVQVSARLFKTLGRRPPLRSLMMDPLSVVAALFEDLPHPAPPHVPVPSPAQSMAAADLRLPTRPGAAAQSSRSSSTRWWRKLFGS
jgi:amino acid adenylation domain-containing protein